MRSNEIRKSFLDYFVKQGHTVKASSSLVSSDPTVLLTTAGMQQFTPFFIGDEEAPEKRYTSSQKCFRTPDIDEVGDETHNTFFEMLGNFSIGDYFKADAIPFAWEYVTNILKLPKEKLWVTVFAGEKGVPRDDEAEKIWLSLGVPKERIREFGRDSNFWGPPGESGPCGPSSEIHMDLGPEKSKQREEHACGPNHSCGRFLELWNLVFMQYYQAEDGVLSALPAKNIDTGAGLERLAMVVQNKPNIFETDNFLPLLEKIGTISGKKYQDESRSFRIIADHIRGATFLIADGVLPGKSGRDYILRRIIRRASFRMRQMGVHSPHLSELSREVIKIYKDSYPELNNNEQKIFNVILEEENKFYKLLQDIVKFSNEFQKHVVNGKLPGKTAFHFYETYGIPKDSLKDWSKGHGVIFEEEEFDKALEGHKELSRVGAMEKFKRKGGGQGEEVKKAHTATHLLHQALRDVLGNTVTQAGSRLFDDELSFDFKHSAKMTDVEKTKVEEIVNQKISLSLPMHMEKLPLDQAKKLGAIGLFEEKYGDLVQVCSILEGDKAYSREFCGGPHVTNTKEVQFFKITKEKSSSAGIRRIKAVVGRKAQLSHRVNRSKLGRPKRRRNVGR